MSGRKQMTIQLYLDRHPALYSRYFDENGDRRPERKASQELPMLAEMHLNNDGANDSLVIEMLERIEEAIRTLKAVGVVDDTQERQLKERASALKRKIPVMR